MKHTILGAAFFAIVMLAMVLGFHKCTQDLRGPVPPVSSEVQK